MAARFFPDECVCVRTKGNGERLAVKKKRRIESEKEVGNAVGIARGAQRPPMCKADVCEVYDARQSSVSSEPVLRGNEKRQRWDNVHQYA
jgi:hypothetical protein